MCERSKRLQAAKLMRTGIPICYCDSMIVWDDYSETFIESGLSYDHNAGHYFGKERFTYRQVLRALKNGWG